MIRRLVLSFAFVLVATTATAQPVRQCKPIIMLPEYEGAGRYPAGLAGYYLLREQALGIPSPPHPEREANPAIWTDLPGVMFEWIDPEWVDAGARRVNPNRPAMVPTCPWWKAREWIEAAICEHPNPHYGPCRAFPGACAVRILTATWAKNPTCKGDWCDYACTGYGEVKAIDAETLRKGGVELE